MNIYAEEDEVLTYSEVFAELLAESAVLVDTRYTQDEWEAHLREHRDVLAEDAGALIVSFGYSTHDEIRYRAEHKIRAINEFLSVEEGTDEAPASNTDALSADADELDAYMDELDEHVILGADLYELENTGASVIAEHLFKSLENDDTYTRSLAEV